MHMYPLTLLEKEEEKAMETVVLIFLSRGRQGQDNEAQQGCQQRVDSDDVDG